MIVKPAEPPQMTRRSAVACIAGVISSTLLAGCDTDVVSPTGDFTPDNTPFKAFTFLHDDSVQVLISEHDEIDKFTLTVRKDGSDVETFEGLNDKTVSSVKSAFIQVTYIDVPSA